MRQLKFVVNCALVVSSIGAFAQESARTVQYHSQDIVPIPSTLITTHTNHPPRTRVLIVDVVGNFCFVHPAKQHQFQLNLITTREHLQFHSPGYLRYTAAPTSR